MVVMRVSVYCWQLKTVVSFNKKQAPEHVHQMALSTQPCGQGRHHLLVVTPATDHFPLPGPAPDCCCNNDGDELFVQNWSCYGKAAMDCSLKASLPGGKRFNDKLGLKCINPEQLSPAFVLSLSLFVWMLQLSSGDLSISHMLLHFL